MIQCILAVVGSCLSGKLVAFPFPPAERKHFWEVPENSCPQDQAGRDLLNERLKVTSNPVQEENQEN